MTDSYEGLARIMGIDDKTATEMRTEYAALEIEWHCPGRHGVVRDVPAKSAGRVQRVIEWHLGHGACKWTKTVNGKTSVEFVDMTKVFPAPKRPWQWCGETILFADWRDSENADTVALATFRLGERVAFVHKGQIVSGEVTKINRKTVSIHVSGQGSWTVPPTQLYKVGTES